MLEHINFSIMAETTPLSRTLVVIRIAHCVSVSPSYDSLLPPKLMQTRWVLALLGVTDTTTRPYVNLSRWDC